MYIRQKGDDLCVTVVDVGNYVGALIDHPKVVETPHLFEVVDGPLPEHYQILLDSLPVIIP